MEIQEKTKLADLTTIKLGGEAKQFVNCGSIEEIQEALRYAKDNNLEVYVLSGGSNTVFPDEGFNGLVIKIDVRGVSYQDENSHTLVTAAAGENWDELVQATIKKDLAGIETLSGIPGSVGATPIQNVGAYGQEVSDVVAKVRAIARKNLKEVEFTNEQCNFGYRTSRFKGEDKGKFIITEVIYTLKKGGAPTVGYPELGKLIKERLGLGNANLQQVRELVLELRKGKSMVIDPEDPNSQSCGSFFTNPMLNHKEFNELSARWKKRARPTRYRGKARQHQPLEPIPSFASGENIKIPAAWLVENAGFYKGYRHKGAGISQNHCLALVNREGSTKDILELAEKIIQAVQATFGIKLECEPEVVT